MEQIKDNERELLRKKIGLLIERTREAKGWSRYELSKQSGVDEAHLMRIEHGLYSIRIDVLNKLCKALNLHIDFPHD